MLTDYEICCLWLSLTLIRNAEYYGLSIINFSKIVLFSWKFAFASFSKASKIFLAPALPKSCRGMVREGGLYHVICDKLIEKCLEFDITGKSTGEIQQA